MRVLVCVLDWGLGHATRCIPIISALLAEGHEVRIASSGRARALLQQNFPALPVIQLPAYGIRYWFGNMYLNMVLQVPRIAWVAAAEYFDIRKLVRKHRLDLLISDSRFGCFHSAVKSIFITHQLHLQLKPAFLSKMVNALHRWFIRRYAECWVPDYEDEGKSLAGALAHPPPMAHVRYIGPLSCMQPMQLSPTYDLVALLSGPEPQRTRFEQEFIRQAMQLEAKVLIIRGIPEASGEQQLSANVTMVNHLYGTALNEALASARLIVCRSGYSSIMDLALLDRPALLVPTPGQTEQEYLARYLCGKEIFIFQTQRELDLKKALKTQMI